MMIYEAKYILFNNWVAYSCYKCYRSYDTPYI